MKNQKGVTLIALVVTIIVLIILAGVAIATLLGDSGPITRAKEAKQNQIEGEVRDKVTLAITSAKAYAEMQSVQKSDYQAEDEIDDGEDTINQIAGELNGWTGTAANNGSGFNYNVQKYAVSGTNGYNGVKITYNSGEYDDATNYSDATIECWIKVDGNNFSFDTYQGGTTNQNTAWKYTRKAAS